MKLSVALFVMVVVAAFPQVQSFGMYLLLNLIPSFPYTFSHALQSMFKDGLFFFWWRPFFA